MLRHFRGHLGLLVGMLIAAIALGIAYRYLFNTIEERTLSFYARSSLHATGMALAGWNSADGIRCPAALALRAGIARYAADRRIRAEGAGDDGRADDRHARSAICAVPLDIGRMVRARPAAHPYPRLCRVAAVRRDFRIQAPDRRPPARQLFSRDISPAAARAAPRHVSRHRRLDGARRT